MRIEASVMAFMAVLFALSCFGGCEAQKLIQDEVITLKKAAKKLKANWNFSIDPCRWNEIWSGDIKSDIVYRNVNCTCDPVCHVTSIELRGQNLTGELPSELANLTKLNYLYLDRNYLGGSIPASWASLPLTNLSLGGNRISGRIPDELGNISTLRSLILFANQLEGLIPATLGKLTMLTVLYLASNNFSGELPGSLGNLKNMSYFVIDGNPISGKIPSFIGNWTKLQALYMVGTSLEGPFPPSLAKLTSITELIVSDIRGVNEFPSLQNLESMTTLVLRNLSISGQIPDYIGDMKNLLLLDLSFNNLTGPIPQSFDRLRSSINHMFLSNNQLSGTIPRWILTSSQNLDVSFNNFNGSPAPPSCSQGNVNLVSSYSPTDSNLIASCLKRNLPCSGKRKNYNLFINCGGPKVTVDGNEYEDDSSSGVTRFNSEKWASSSTGVFLDSSSANYIVANNASLLNISNLELYTTARLSPLSLKYYGLCLQKGNYNVSLHFAEIIFTNDQTYSSVGRRIFDVSIQGQNILHDFNIAKEANGTGKGIIKSINTEVDGTLEIHFYWAGKGTTSFPTGGVYGPLISAISVTPNFKPDTGNKISVGAILGIVAGICAVVVLISIALWVCWRKKQAEYNVAGSIDEDGVSESGKTEFCLEAMRCMRGQRFLLQLVAVVVGSHGSVAQPREFRGLELHTARFSLKQIEAATNNFDVANKIGEGGFGPVYKGTLPNGSRIAVKKLSSKSKQGNREFITEIGMISALQHPNLVKLYGCGIEGNQLLLIYEYMENNSLARALFGPERTRLNLDWQTRRMISLGIARGLTYLHEESTLKIVHRDIKATNILLDKDLNAKISDFGLAKLDEEDNSHISTRVAGTIGYMAPEYAMRGYLTEKADVYSFGVVMLEIVSGISNTGYRPKEDFTYLLDWAYVLEEQGKLLDLVDPNLGTNYSKEEALQMLSLCLMCTNPSPTLRPLMSTVVSILEGKSPVQIPPVKHAALNYGDASFKSFEGCSYDNQMHNVSNDEPGTESSISLQSMKDAVAHSLLSIVHSDYSEASTINLESETGNVDGPNFNSTLESRIP